MPAFQQLSIRFIVEYMLQAAPLGLTSRNLEAMADSTSCHLYFENEFLTSNMAFSGSVTLFTSEHNLGMAAVVHDLQGHFNSIVVESVEAINDPTRQNSASSQKYFGLYLNQNTFVGQDAEHLTQDVKTAQAAKARPHNRAFSLRTLLAEIIDVLI